jgi:hypothetical protein
MTYKLKEWTPSELGVFLRDNGISHMDQRDQDLFMRLATDERIKPFWEWLEATNDKLADEGYEYDPVSVFWTAVRGTERLEKPANLPPKKKATYLSDVQEHAAALVELLSGTQFDIRLEEFCERSGMDISDFYEMQHYPECTLTEQLQELIGWADQPDCHDSAGNPTWMIRQGGDAARKHFLAAELLRDFDQMLGQLPPNQRLAGLMSAILDTEVFEEAAQKLVKRIREREGDVRFIKIDGHDAPLLDRYMMSLLKKADS